MIQPLFWLAALYRKGPKMFLTGVAVLAAVAVIAGAYWKGRGDEQTKTEKQNAEAGLTAAEAGIRFMRCDSSGGVYDFDTHECNRPASGNR